MRAPEPISLQHELAVLEQARAAVQTKLRRLKDIKADGADAVTADYIASVIAGTVEKLTQELVVFGRIDDDHAWRIGLYGIDDGSDQLVVDWRAPFAANFYQARFDEPLGPERRVSYVGSIVDLMVEEFATGEVTGSSPLLTELSRSRGAEMRMAVATLQSEQDELVRLSPDATLVLRGGPGTGKTVVGLHRAAWLVYNDTRLTADRLLVIGPSGRFLAYVASVLPTLGEARIHQTTFERLLGPSSLAGSDERWIEALDRFEAGLVHPTEFKVGARTIPEHEVVEAVERVSKLNLPWRDRRRLFVDGLARARNLSAKEVNIAATSVFPVVTPAQVMRALRRQATLESIGLPPDVIAAWLAVDHGGRPEGPLADEVQARFAGVPARYSHVIVDEAQDLSLLQLRAGLRRSKGVTVVGDDAQRSAPNSLGLRRVANLLDRDLVEMRTAYRMSAEIADWLNEHAERHLLDAVHLDGVRPTGVHVRSAVGSVGPVLADLHERWGTVAHIRAGEVWQHKGVEYDAVVVDRKGMSAGEVYLAASRAAHELVLA
ncbi:MAG: AAA family ATPase [Actinomycetota bacterium]|nr:AAA family ATPase [Actinomycetota bacterium]